MDVFKKMEEYGQEQVIFGVDKNTGLKAIIAVHDTTLGPALGGTRMWDYNSDEDAFTDVLRLSRGMTLKNSAAGLNLGGGKAVIIGNPKMKTPELLQAYGRLVERAGGVYITAEDVNITAGDAEIIRRETKCVAGLPGKSGDPSPMTARGVLQGIRATAKAVWNLDDLSGLTIAVQGLGRVGWLLCELLHREGAKLVTADIDAQKSLLSADTFGAKAVDAREVLYTDCDILAPCALGGVLSADNIPLLKCKAVAGAANNVLSDQAAGNMLFSRGIAYAPDYIINAGGVINAAGDVDGRYDRQKAVCLIDRIYDTVMRILQESALTGIPEYMIAEKIAVERIESAKREKRVK